MEATSSVVPSEQRAKDESSLPLSVIAQPAHSSDDETLLEALQRCAECGAYACYGSDFSGDNPPEWICALCGEGTPASAPLLDRLVSSHTTPSSPRSRSALLARETLASPLHWPATLVLLDLSRCASSASDDCARACARAALHSTLHSACRFALAALDCTHHLQLLTTSEYHPPHTKRTQLPLSAPLHHFLPLHNFLLHSSDAKHSASDAIDALHLPHPRDLSDNFSSLHLALDALLEYTSASTSNASSHLYIPLLRICIVTCGVQAEAQPSVTRRDGMRSRPNTGTNTSFSALASRSASAGTVVDTFVIAPDCVGSLAAMAPLSERTSGNAFVCASAHSNNMPRNVYQALTQPAAFHCKSALRCGLELQCPHGFNPLLNADARIPGLFYYGMCMSSDAITLELSHQGTGFLGSEGIPTLQLATDFTKFDLRDPSVGVVRKRWRRVQTWSGHCSPSCWEIQQTACFREVTQSLMHQVSRIICSDGVNDAREAVMMWFAKLMASVSSGSHRQHNAKRKNESVDRQLDATFHTCEALRPIPRMVQALLRSDMLRPGANDDFRWRAMLAFARLKPYDLEKALYPLFMSFNNENEVESPMHPLTREAMSMSSAAVFLLDAYFIILIFVPASAEAALPPAEGSLIEGHIKSAKEQRTTTPEVTYLRGGIDDISPLNRWLIEDPDPEGISTPEASGLQGLLAEAERRAKKYVQKN